VWLYQTFPSAEAEAQLERRVGDLAGADLNRTLIVMGTSKYGWNAYNAALALAARGYHHILWYRGGEEAWAASGMMSDDRRDP
jgi:rhodanese-related sulfurtransferase